MGKNELDNLASFVHGALAFGHALGLIYNLKRKNYLDASIHASACAYDCWATYKHVNRLKEPELTPEYLYSKFK